jgi:UDP-N-acetylmuramyl pentapeptide phosphotransferase/UDP-N-acetylglucosamine-1-phosphate transferase/glycosyltransferase involved in cell wall biosynthesis
MNHGVQAAIAFGGALVGSLILTPLAAKLARGIGIVDLPNARKVHQTPIPRCGGIAIALAMALAAIPILIPIALSQTPGAEGWTRLLPLLSAGAIVLLVGLLDDLFGVPSSRKLLALVLAAVVVCASGARIDSIVIRHVQVLPLGWLSWPVTIFWIIGVTVGLNFIDGLDGLAAGIAAIAATALGIAALATDQYSVAVIAFALAGSLIGFLFFNFHPAKIFMGDCGSMFIGFMIAATGVLCSSSHHVGTSPGILIPGMALIIPAFDTLFTLIRRRVLQRRSIFSAERGHIHHRLLDMGLRHQHVVLLLWAVSLASASAGLLMRFANGWLAASAIIVASASVIVLFRTSGSSRARETVLAIRRNRDLGREWRRYRHAFEEAQLRFRNAVGFDAWWQEVCTAAEALEFISVTLPLVNRDGTPRLQRWHRNDGGTREAEIARATLPIRQRRIGGPLQAEVEVAAHTSLESAGHRIALFSRLMGEHCLANLPAVCVETVAPTAEPVPEVADEIGSTQLRIAIVHDFLYTYAGAERVLEQILAVFPQADLFSLFDFLPADNRQFIRNKPVKTSFIQKMPFARRKHRLYLPFMPLAIEQLDVSAYDLVISSSYLAAKGVITRPNQLHICYCHSPARFAWDMQGQYLSQTRLVRGVRSLVARSILHYIRSWDVRSANGVDVFVTNSNFVGQRVQKIYRRQSSVVYPPVNTEKFSVHAAKEDFYLTASRLVPYKRIDLIVDAFNRMPEKKLIIVGDGPEMEKLKAKAGPNVRLLGQQPAERLRRYLQLARGFIFAAEEDFGIAPVEAQACGTPVLAYGRGGVLESVIAGQTGLFFMEQTAQSIIDAIAAFEKVEWNARAIRRHSENFSTARFRQQLRNLVEKEWAAFLERQQQPVDHLSRLADQLVESIEGARLEDESVLSGGRIDEPTKDDADKLVPEL